MKAEDLKVGMEVVRARGSEKLIGRIGTVKHIINEMWKGELLARVVVNWNGHPQTTLSSFDLEPTYIPYEITEVPVKSRDNSGYVKYKKVYRRKDISSPVSE